MMAWLIRELKRFVKWVAIIVGRLFAPGDAVTLGVLLALISGGLLVTLVTDNDGHGAVYYPRKLNHGLLSVRREDMIDAAVAKGIPDEDARRMTNVQLWPVYKQKMSSDLEQHMKDMNDRNMEAKRHLDELDKADGAGEGQN